MAMETATLGGGCFWCIEGALRHLNGVSRAESGYAGGHLPNPTYEQVCGKRTGHAEVVRLEVAPGGHLVVAYKVGDGRVRRGGVGLEGAGGGVGHRDPPAGGAVDLAATQAAWPRTVAFFRQHLER